MKIVQEVHFHSLSVSSMNNKIIIASLLFPAFLSSACAADKGGKVELKSKTDSVSYAIGMDIGKNFKEREIAVNLDILKAAMSDVLNGKPTTLTQEQVQQVMTAFGQEMQQKAMAKQQKAADENKAKGEKFLAENKNKTGVKTTASGLQYKVLSEGKPTGKQPTDKSTVKVHYVGTTIDGKEFDSSIKRNEPAEFPLNGVIKGWTEGLQLMKEGAKFEFYIPAALAYGDRGAGQDIGPNEILIFQVELLEVK